MNNFLILCFLFYCMVVSNYGQTIQDMNIETLTPKPNRERKSIFFGNDHLLQTIMRRIKVKANLEKQKTEELLKQHSLQRIKAALKTDLFNFRI
jgi:hypothetical protein